MRPNSVLSTSSSSSDEHDNLSFYRVSKKGAYERSSSVTEGRNLERIPEDPGEYFPDVRRRGSLPGDFNIGYSMRKRLPSGSLLSPTSTDFFRKNALGNRFLDDFSLLIEKYGFTSPTDVSGHEAIPEENDFFE